MVGTLVIYIVFGVSACLNDCERLRFLVDIIHYSTVFFVTPDPLVLAPSVDMFTFLTWYPDSQ